MFGKIFITQLCNCVMLVMPLCGTVINLTSSKSYKWSTAVGLYKRTNEKVGSRRRQMRSAFSAFEAKRLRHILIVSWTDKRTNNMNCETSNLSQGIADQSTFLRCERSRSAKNFFRNSRIWIVIRTSTETERFVSSTTFVLWCSSSSFPFNNYGWQTQPYNT